jgi:hypothetical protein
MQYADLLTLLCLRAVIPVLISQRGKKPHGIVQKALATYSAGPWCIPPSPASEKFRHVCKSTQLMACLPVDLVLHSPHFSIIHSGNGKGVAPGWLSTEGETGSGK